MRYDVVAIGDALEDVFVEPELKVKNDRSCLGGKSMTFEFGEKIPLKWVRFDVGGSACNAAVGFSRLGFKASLIAMLGKDDPKDKILARLRREKVDTKNLIIDAKYQTGYSTLFSVNGERTIFVFHGPKDYKDVEIPNDLETDWFYISPLGHSTDCLERDVVSFASEKDVKIAWNPGSIQIAEGASKLRHLLKCTSILFLNREEAIKFLNYPVRPHIDEVMKRLYEFGPRIVVVTDGKDGVRAYNGKEFFIEPAKHFTSIVDATGAGDSFAVGFLSKLLLSDFKNGVSNGEIEVALKFGIAESSSVIQHMGAQEGLLRK